jgi:hypothetical protein
MSGQLEIKCRSALLGCRTRYSGGKGMSDYEQRFR